MVHVVTFGSDIVVLCSLIPWGSYKVKAQNFWAMVDIWVISPSHSKDMLVLVKIAILQSLSFFNLEFRI